MRHAILILAVLLAGCIGSEGATTGELTARGVCISRCIAYHLDEITDADHGTVAPELYRDVAAECHELYACQPCVKDGNPKGDHLTCSQQAAGQATP